MSHPFDDVYWFGVSEACKYLSVSKRTLYNYMQDGRLPFYYLAGTRQRRLKREDLDRLLVPGNPNDSLTDEIDDIDE